MCGTPVDRPGSRGPWPKRCPEHQRAFRRRFHLTEDVAARARWKLRAVLKRFGLTEESYADLVVQQGGGCGICGRTEDEEGRRLGIDHDHRCCGPGQRACVRCRRGALCSTCNTALGLFGDDPDTVMSAYWYLVGWRDRQPDLLIPDFPAPNVAQP